MRRWTPGADELRRLPARLGSRSNRLGLVGAVLLLGGVALYLALSTQVYLTDETSHVGYTMELREGRLPSIYTVTPSEGGGPDLEAALRLPWPYSTPNIHVANNPPFPYIAAIPLAELSSRLGMDGKYLFGVRMLNVLGGALGVFFAYLLGRELSGGDGFVGVVTAGMIAGTIGIALIVSIANLGGPAFAATTATTWALARFARTRTLRHAAHLGIFCALAAATRPMAAVFALVACALGFVLGVHTHGWRAIGHLTLRLAVPALVLTGWFYALNVYRYDDPTGTSALGVAGPGTYSRVDLLLGAQPFVEPLHYMVWEVYGRYAWWESTGLGEYSVTVVALLLVATAIGLAVRSTRHAREQGRPPKLVASAWISLTLLGAVPMLLIAQHMSVGGAGHARYLMPTLPIIASAAALVTSRISRWLSVAVVTAFAVAALTRMHAESDLYRVGTLGGFRPSLGGQPFIGISVAVAVAGALLLLGSLVAMALDSSRPTSGGAAAREPLLEGAGA